MQEWLDSKGLDRKVLANLAQNCNAAEAYQEYCAYEVKNVVDDMLDIVSHEEQGIQEGNEGQKEGEKIENEAKEEETIEKEQSNEAKIEKEPIVLQEAAQTMKQLPVVKIDEIKANEAGNHILLPNFSIF